MTTQSSDKVEPPTSSVDRIPNSKEAASRALLGLPVTATESMSGKPLKPQSPRLLFDPDTFNPDTYKSLVESGRKAVRRSQLAQARKSLSSREVPVVLHAVACQEKHVPIEKVDDLTSVFDSSWKNLHERQISKHKKSVDTQFEQYVRSLARKKMLSDAAEAQRLEAEQRYSNFVSARKDADDAQASRLQAKFAQCRKQAQEELAKQMAAKEAGYQKDIERGNQADERRKEYLQRVSEAAKFKGRFQDERKANELKMRKERMEQNLAKEINSSKRHEAYLEEVREAAAQRAEARRKRYERGLQLTKETMASRQAARLAALEASTKKGDESYQRYISMNQQRSEYIAKKLQASKDSANQVLKAKAEQFETKLKELTQDNSEKEQYVADLKASGLKNGIPRAVHDSHRKIWVETFQANKKELDAGNTLKRNVALTSMAVNDHKASLVADLRSNFEKERQCEARKTLVKKEAAKFAFQMARGETDPKELEHILMVGHGGNSASGGSDFSRQKDGSNFYSETHIPPPICTEVVEHCKHVFEKVSRATVKK